ncbi:MULTISPECIES: thiamine phosphate synthase [Colwellia]|uniref:Thiamine-phosphate synthase n=1 Tax=Colwellia marinimaniae TaxID=1513592 RepID=A0ABQ0MRV4_9GAMM|nr:MULTISPECIES: thiamine phosphate synthase [Colwellia]GAW95085.1 bifunctional hydroxymethylpyrimidine kinase/phosphomethylpyrimidine kinase [Colwellia marinimaniae]
MTIKPKPIIWTISGSDCSGGAGIAADIKTGHALGVEVCHLITANTVQNSQQLLSVNAVSVEILQQQATLLIDDKPPSVIKIGLVANVEQVHWLAKLLKQFKVIMPNLISVYDPVGQASVGGSFSCLSLEQLTPLLMIVDVITPNLMEAKILARVDKLAKLAEANDVEVLAKKIYQDFAINSIIIKGGHSHADDKHARDYCYHQLNQLSDEKQDNQEKLHQTISYQLNSPRLATHYSHGGGCSFASALASFLAQGYLMRDAFMLSKAFINQGLAATVPVSASQKHQYYGAFEQQAWPLNGSDRAQHFAEVVDDLSGQYQELPAFSSLDLNGEILGLYPVIDSLYWLKRLLPLGLKIIQLRVKNLTENELEQVIIAAVALAKNYGTRLFINDYWQLAIKHGAYGVHIGQEDLADADLVAIQRSGIRLGISTHGCYEFILAQQLQPSYLAIGAIFPTKTKDMTGQIQGLDNLRQVLSLRPAENAWQIPVVAIGGINLERAIDVVATGVESIAVVTAITEAEQSHGITPEQAVAAFEQIIVKG